jgi:hypothetical protein
VTAKLEWFGGYDVRRVQGVILSLSIVGWAWAAVALAAAACRPVARYLETPREDWHG